MAARLETKVKALLNSISEEGIAGVSEHPEVVSLIKALHGDATMAQQHDALLKALESAAEEHINGTEESTLAALAVLGMLAKDIDVGEAAAPKGSPHESKWKLLVSKLHAGLISALGRYPTPGSSEGRTKQDLMVSAGAVAITIYPKIKSFGHPQLQLACEAALLRLLRTHKSCFEFMRSLETEDMLLESFKQAVKDGPTTLAASLADVAGQEGDEEEGEAEDLEEEEDLDDEDSEEEDEEEDEEEEEEEEVKPAKGKVGRKGAAPKRAQPVAGRVGPHGKRMKK